MNLKDFNFDLKQIRTFMEVVNEKSFTNASRNLKLSQASISHQINQLEKMLGVKLIHRNSQDFSLTHEGSVFFKFCEKILTDIDELKSNLISGYFGGLIHIAASSIPGTYLLPKVLSRLNEIFPQFRYRVDIVNSREAIEIVKQGEADLAITGREIKHPSLNFIKVYEDEILFVTHPDKRIVKSVDEIKNLPLITRETGSGTKNMTETYLQEHGLITSELNILMECSTSEGVREAVLNGLGYAFISNIAIENDLKLGKIKVIKLHDFKIKRNFYVVTSKARILTQPVSEFVEKFSSIELWNKI
ncbi:MAG: HTH-type transcriptional regulator CysL [Spirochaetes bacterium ADurb.Bin218]|jgi:DNA-binding transcriptional LysR family regulator|nr:MAG: HTH-type transcriptional regulator CysL [Spirochaetes bacterium ADurb.Bin218]